MRTRSRTRGRKSNQTNFVERRGESAPRRRQPRKKSKPKLKSTAQSDYLRYLYAILLAYLVYDLYKLGLSGHLPSTPLIDLFDMLATVSYLKERQPVSYSLLPISRSAPLVCVTSFFYYIIAGKFCRALMRRRFKALSSSFFPEFLLTGFLPIHLFPSNALSIKLEKNDVTQLVVCLIWAATKQRSMNSITEEALNEHKYDFASVLLLNILSLVFTSLISKIDVAVVTGRMSVPSIASVSNWLLSKTVFASTVASALLVLRHSRNTNILPPQLLNALVYLALFYRYANGLVERVVKSYMNKGKKIKGK